MNDASRFRRLAGGSLLLAVLLLASHGGEFWPFSYLPMFSKGGRPFSRMLVRDVGTVPPARYREPALLGEPFPLARAGIEQTDVSKLVASFGSELEPDEAHVLARLFEQPRRARTLLIYAAQGELARGGVELRYRPLFVLDARGAHGLGP